MAEDRQKRGVLDQLGGVLGFSRNIRFATLAFSSTFWTWIIGGVLLGLAIITVVINLGGASLAGEEVKPSPTTAPLSSVHFYCQYTSSYSTQSCQIQHFGCVPTSLAMILTSFGDTTWDPNKTALENNLMGCGFNCNPDERFCGTDSKQAYDAVQKTKSLGYTVADSLANGQNFDLKWAKEYIEKGYLILGGADIFFRIGKTLEDPLLVKGGHSFVIRSVDLQSRTIKTLDPTFCDSDTNYIERTIVLDGVNNWYYAYPMKKI